MHRKKWAGSDGLSFYYFFFFLLVERVRRDTRRAERETRHNHPVSSEGYDHHLLTARASSSTTVVVSAFCVSRSHEQATSNKTIPCTLFLRLSAPCFTALFILFSTTSLDPSPPTPPIDGSPHLHKKTLVKSFVPAAGSQTSQCSHLCANSARKWRQNPEQEQDEEDVQLDRILVNPALSVDLGVGPSPPP